ncbi:hypothetical protein AG1IA_01584 [Rhizoctonia solani AG-1 IA]|uniref:Uncharacterized protein n=1 Tax=Thanatephorus cucumeris (strain AG1-IA) TaxID=983506 RepID=L8X258_THACA|nr:hypothetical protein AG1IA_01584 [Rhizoctonia solani AG-1 IA]
MEIAWTACRPGGCGRIHDRRRDTARWDALGTRPRVMPRGDDDVWGRGGKGYMGRHDRPGARMRGRDDRLFGQKEVWNGSDWRNLALPLCNCTPDLDRRYQGGVPWNLWTVYDLYLPRLVRI